MSDAALVRTGRLVLSPIGWQDLDGLVRLKTDPRVFALMLGGVRHPTRVAEELAEDIAFWGQHGIGLFTIHERRQFQGITGLHLRPDGRGMALRFAVWPEARGRGIAREAASAALYYAHHARRIDRVIGVAREDNFGSRFVLGGIGMAECGRFLQAGNRMVLYESRREKLIIPPGTPTAVAGGKPDARSP